MLASIIQNCKAHNKCFTSSPQDATPVQGLHFSAHGAQSGAKRREGGEGRAECTGGRGAKIYKRVKGLSAFQSI